MGSRGAEERSALGGQVGFSANRAVTGSWVSSFTEEVPMVAEVLFGCFMALEGLRFSVDKAVAQGQAWNVLFCHESGHSGLRHSGPANLVGLGRSGVC